MQLNAIMQFTQIDYLDDMIKKIIKKIKAIKALIMADEYFLTVANQKNLHDQDELGPIVYDYIHNTDRDLFYVFVKSYIKQNLGKNDN